MLSFLVGRVHCVEARFCMVSNGWVLTQVIDCDIVGWVTFGVAVLYLMLWWNDWFVGLVNWHKRIMGVYGDSR